MAAMKRARIDWKALRSDAFDFACVAYVVLMTGAVSSAVHWLFARFGS